MSPTSRQLTPEQRFQLFLDAASDYAIFFTDENAAINEWSNSAEKILGYTEREALQLNGRDIFTAEDRARGAPEHEMEIAVREGQANDERWHVRKDGSRFFAVGRLVALKDSAGELWGFVKIVRDATPYKNLEQALHASDEQFRATFSQSPLGMVLTTMSGRIQQVNAAFCQLTGYGEKELEGRELLSLTVPEERAVVGEQIDDLLYGKRAAALIEKRLLRADGSTVWVQNSAALLRDAEGRPICFIDLCQDISVLKLSAGELERVINVRTAALQSKTRQLESFCYTVAHDLRAPLRAIAGYAEFLRLDFERQLAADGMDYVRRIEASATRLDHLISDLLGYTRMQQVPLIREVIDLTAIVDKVIEQMLRDYRGEAPTIEVARPLGSVRGDAVTVEHVFMNLLSNALKFRRENVPPMIHIVPEQRDKGLRVWVTDNGIGIDPRFKDRVFGMFERLHPELKIPGTGVGLAIVATAMERLGGSCGVEQNVPWGSRFWIEFPS